MFDRIEKIGRSVVQHGKNNNRVYLMKLDRADLDTMAGKLIELATSKGYTKIIAKVPDWACQTFLVNGYREEALVPGFYHGSDKVHFMSFFCDAKRGLLPQDAREVIDQTVKIALSRQDNSRRISLPDGFHIRPLAGDDVNALAGLYQQVFKTYPFPIFDPDYIKETMQSHIQYFGAFKGGTLCAASSAEMDMSALNAEMTDFATHPDFRGRNISYLLLLEMEKAMAKQNLKMLYTIARAYSCGMNVTFARCGYSFAGTLINNTLISDGIESMNIWYKKL